MASDGNPRWSRRQLQPPSGVVASHQPEEEYDTFWYLKLDPFGRQALQIRGDGRVQLYSREADFADGRPSGWTGRSSWHKRCGCDHFLVDLNCRGEEAHLRRLVVLPDVASHVWFAYHEDTQAPMQTGPEEIIGAATRRDPAALWAVLVYAGRRTEHDVQSSLDSSRRDRGPLQQAGPCPFAPFPRYDERAAPRSHSDMLNSSDRDRAFGRYDERAAPRSPSESPRELPGQVLMTGLMTPRDNGAPPRGFQAFSGVPYKLDCINQLD